MTLLKTGFLGLGAMGLPMAQNLHRKGLLTAVWNRSANKCQAFSDDDTVTVCLEPGELAAQCNVLVTCVTADKDVLELHRNMMAEAKQGTIAIDMSTVEPATASALANEWQDRGCHFIDAPVSGGVEGAIKGTLSIMCGGDETVLKSIMPVMEAMGASIIHLGEAGSGQACKAINQIMVAGIAEAVCEALVLAENMGLDTDKVIDLISGGAAGSWFLKQRGKTMVAGEYDIGFQSALLFKDLGIVQNLCESENFSSSVVTQAVNDYHQLVQMGLGKKDISALYVLKKQSLE